MWWGGNKYIKNLPNKKPKKFTKLKKTFKNKQNIKRRKKRNAFILVSDNRLEQIYSHDKHFNN